MRPLDGWNSYGREDTWNLIVHDVESVCSWRKIEALGYNKSDRLSLVNHRGGDKSLCYQEFNVMVEVGWSQS